MKPVDALTHHHPVFLKQAYAQGDHITLHNDLRFIKDGAKYISFNPAARRFCVFKHPSRFLSSHDNIVSAMLTIRR